ncbi:unnamed protein product [Linum trigynum]|uniref:Cystatin domain-containing protein n=1 Tax=Linum trigynum TaxID=586398 RepID=A0AAV2EIY5_9ROSI
MDTQQPPLLSLDANPKLPSDESAPGSDSGSPTSETGLESEPKKQKLEEAGGGDDDEEVADGDGSENDEEEDDEDVQIIYVEEEDDGTVREEFVQAPSEPIIWYPKDKEGQKIFERYFEIVKESEGFDIGELPPVDVIERGVVPVDWESEFQSNNVENCVIHVIREYNEENKGVSELRPDEIEKANLSSCGGENYYITFDATDLLSPDPNLARKTYQAEVYRNIEGGVLSTTLFREKGQKQFIYVKEDRQITYI